MRSKQAQGREQGRRAAMLSHGPARALQQEIRQQRQHPWVLPCCGHGEIITTSLGCIPGAGMLQPWDLPLLFSSLSLPLSPLGCPHAARRGHEGPAGCSPASARAPRGPKPSTHSCGRRESKRCKERQPAASPTTHSQAKGHVANCKSEIFQQKYFLPTKIALLFCFVFPSPKCDYIFLVSTSKLETKSLAAHTVDCCVSPAPHVPWLLRHQQPHRTQTTAPAPFGDASWSR